MLNFNQGSEKDPREVIEPGQRGTPQGAIGHILDKNKMTIGTGFLVGRCTVMTNVHVINDGYNAEVTKTTPFYFSIQTKNFFKKEDFDSKFNFGNHAFPVEWGGLCAE